jgi:carbon-monoxide dehydrogenase medium subunit
MKPSLFGYRAPKTLDEAIAMLASDADAAVLAGGQSLLPAMNFRLANPSLLIDIQHVDGLHGISVEKDRIVVRAMVRHREFELDPAVRAANPLIHEVMQHVAHVPIRNRGTVVGSLCHADPSAEMPLLLTLLGGSVIAQGPQGQREIGAEEFFTSFLSTARRQDEIIVEARFPTPPAGAGAAFDEVTRRHGDYALAAVGCVITLDGHGKAATVQLGASGIADKPLRLKEAQRILTGSALAAGDLDAAVTASLPLVTQSDEANASVSFRRRALGALIRRMVAKAAERARSGSLQ